MDSRKIIWISHRGYKANAPENSRAAFDAAVALGFQTLETDLRLTADGHIVLHHDPDLVRLTGQQLHISSMTRRELESVKVDGHDLMFLDEFVSRYADRSWVFDVKPETSSAVIKRLADMENQQPGLRLFSRKTRFVLWKVADSKLVSSIWPDADLFARELECWRAGLAVLAGLPAFGGIRSGVTYSLPARLGPINLYTPKTISAFHRRGARVLAFLPDDNDVVIALHAGVDEVLTNGQIVYQ